MSLQVRNNETQSIIKSELSTRYEDSNKELSALTKLIISSIPEYFEDLRGIKIKLFFTKKQISEHTGRCKKLEDSVRFKTGIDFYILIWKDEFESLNRFEKAKLIVHELHHITKDKKGLPRIRKHNEREDFCELPSHDLFSENAVLRIKDRVEQLVIQN